MLASIQVSATPIMFNQTTTFTHLQHAGGIHELIIRRASQAAISEWLRCLDQIIRDTPAHRPLRLLTDARASILPPLAYVTHLAHAFMRQADGIDGARSAFLHLDGALDETEATVINQLFADGHNPIRFFHPSARATALHWLAQR